MNRKQYAVCLLFCFLIFAIGFSVAVSLTLPDIFVPQARRQASISSIVSRLQTASTFKLILFNNSKVFLLLTLGILTCGILSVIQSFIIGGSIGLIVQIGMSQGASPFLLVAALLPHGVFEITAFMLVAALGFYFPFRIYRHIQGLTIDWVQEAKTYGLLSLGAYVALFLAAGIETFLTPSIAVKFLH
ncbi:MAG: stage II sporulation protein M [Acidobacteria bacterium]|nr:stage II sporulation protein M [Acidobacteriota bacterium]